MTTLINAYSSRTIYNDCRGSTGPTVIVADDTGSVDDYRGRVEKMGRYDVCVGGKEHTLLPFSEIYPDYYRNRYTPEVIQVLVRVLSALADSRLDLRVLMY